MFSTALGVSSTAAGVFSTAGVKGCTEHTGLVRRYTVLTPSACSGEDLSVLAGLLEEGKIKALVTKVLFVICAL